MDATPTTPFEPALESWLTRRGERLAEVLPLPGDVSLRRYTRLLLAGGGSVILATYPAEVRATLTRFAATSELLTRAGVRVPRVLDADAEHGWMLLEDLGAATLADRRGQPWRELGRWFEEAVEIGRRIASLPVATAAALSPPLGRELLARELEQTWTLYLEPEGLAGAPALAGRLRAALETLCANLAAEEALPCHRDFMARNLMPLDEARLAVLDHQDLRLGPPAYDLASLLNDTLFPPPELEDALVEAMLPGDRGRLSYHRAAAQRTLKAVGTYVSFARRGSPRHLPLVPETLGRALGHLARTPEGEPLAAALAAQWERALGGGGSAVC